MPEQLKVLQGNFSLIRLPERRNELLRAWDAADEYLLNTLPDIITLSITSKILLVNDSFGALAVALSAYHPQAWSDSYLSQQATRLNLRANGLDENAVNLLDSLQTPTGLFEVIVIKVPKTLAFLEDLLLRLRPQLNANTKIIVAGMLKQLPASVWTLLERLIGPTSSSLAKKKARLIFAYPDPALKEPDNPYPSSYILENTAYEIVNHANVFSRAQLDIGTRFFIQHLPSQAHAQTIVDLGCGNGLVGLIAAARNPQAKLVFVDESFMAIASARQNFVVAFGDQHSAVFKVGDGLQDFTPGSVELILCNPPFHQQQTIGDHIAASFFRQAYKTLTVNGELWIVGNRHLGYQASLQKLFGNCTVVAANHKFVILKVNRKAIKQAS
ncbi:MAG: methyltransferase [Methylococcales bacterium]